MSGPSWLAGTFAMLMVIIAAYCASRLAVSWLWGRNTERDVDVVHVLMGVAMAGMLEPRLTPVPGTAWGAAFAAAAGWFGYRALRAGRARGACPAAHAVECAAMVYMLLPVGSWSSGRGRGMAAMPGMSQGATVGNPAITLMLALFMLGYVVWTVDRLASSSRVAPGAAGLPGLAPVTVPGGALAPAVAGASAIAHPRPALTPRLAACYKVVMAIAMGYMLVTMLFS